MDDLVPGSVEKVFGPTLAENAGIWTVPTNAEKNDQYKKFKKKCSKQQLRKVLKKQKKEPNNKFGILENDLITESIVRKEICEPAIKRCYNYKANPGRIPEKSNGKPIWEKNTPIYGCFQTLADINFKSRTFDKQQKEEEPEIDEEEEPEIDEEEEPETDDEEESETDDEETSTSTSGTTPGPIGAGGVDSRKIPDYNILGKDEYKKSQYESDEDFKKRTEFRKKEEEAKKKTAAISKQTVGTVTNTTVMCKRDRKGNLVRDENNNPVPKGCIQQCISTNNPPGCKFVCDEDGKPDGCFDQKAARQQTGTGINYSGGLQEKQAEKIKENPSAKNYIPSYTSTISYLTFDPNISSYTPDKKPVFSNYKTLMDSHINSIETDAVNKCNMMCGDSVHGCNHYTVKKEPVGKDAEKKVTRMQEELFFTDFGKWVATDNGTNKQSDLFDI